MHRTFAFLAIPALLLAAGCSAYGVVTRDTPAVAPFAATDAGRATVCVVRSGFPAPLYTIVVRDNGTLVGATHDGTYFCYLADPGRHVIVSDATFGTRTATLNAAPGHRYYLRQQWLVPGVRGHALSWIEASVAEEDIRYDEYAVVTEAPSTETLPDARPVAPAR
jgi:hypothetical protein